MGHERRVSWEWRDESRGKAFERRVMKDGSFGDGETNLGKRVLREGS